MNVEITKVTTLYPYGVFLQWILTPDNGVVGDYTFSIQRSGSPEGNWTTLIANLSAVTYVDSFDKPNTVTGEINESSLTAEIYYTVTATTPDGSSSVTSVPVDLYGLVANDPKQVSLIGGTNFNKRKWLLRRKIIRDQTVMLQKLNGIELRVLKKKYFGVRCADCFDPLTGEIIISHCKTCYGTGWVGGYYAPIITYGRVAATNVRTALTTEGLTDTDFAQFTLLDYPKVEVGDIVVEHLTNRRWLVQQVAPTELRRVIVHQRVAVSELPRNNAEYMIAV